MTPNDEEEEHMSEQHIYNDNPIGRQSVTNLLDEETRNRECYPEGDTMIEPTTHRKGFRSSPPTRSR
jgi:hypothetical protein